jgi:hypothetical protein
MNEEHRRARPAGVFDGAGENVSRVPAETKTPTQLAWFITAIMRPFLSSGGRDCMKTCSGTANSPGEHAEQQHASACCPRTQAIDAPRRCQEATVKLPSASLRADHVAAAGDAGDDEAGEHADDADPQQAEVDAAFGDDAADGAADGDADADQRRHVAGVWRRPPAVQFFLTHSRLRGPTRPAAKRCSKPTGRRAAADRRRASAACRAER